MFKLRFIISLHLRTRTIFRSTLDRDFNQANAIEFDFMLNWVDCEPIDTF